VPAGFAGAKTAMTTYIALLRAVNVGGAARLLMSELKAMCVAEGFAKVQTYIASGNVLFSVNRSEAAVKAALEKRLHVHVGKPVGVVIRTAKEMAAVLEGNPFPRHPAKWTVAVFLDAAPRPDALASVKGCNDEKLCLGRREIYIAYGSGIAHSRLEIPAARFGTARNINTIARLVELAASV
jgi:uncharacterized protein (DUF1697 family)